MNFLKTISLAGTGLCMTACPGAQPTENQKPNIIFIIADDLGYGDLGCYGQELIKTPNIDKLASEGIRFTQFYSGCTVCAPSRSSLVTGLHTGHTPVRGNKEYEPEGQHPLPKDTYTIGKMLQSAGYTTGCFGKWGLGYPGSEGAPEKQGFDTFFGYNCQRLAHNYYPYYLWHNTDTIWLKGNEGTQANDYSQDIIQKEALKFINSNKEKPFFAFLTYVIPHAELINPEDSITMMYRDQFPEKPYKGTDDGPNYRKGGYGSNPHPKADFAAMITRLDAYVGEIISELKKSGLDKNTLVMFTSDNGPHQEGGADPHFFKSYGPLKGVKRDMYEGGIRVPFIAWLPEKIKSGVSDHVGAFWDIMPTFAALAGVEVAGETDGLSILPVLFGKKGQKKHEYLYWEFHEQGGRIAVRKDNWKAIWFDVGKPDKTYVELYDLSKDIHEDNNLALQYPDVVKELTEIKNSAHTPSEVWNF